MLRPKLLLIDEPSIGLCSDAGRPDLRCDHAHSATNSAPRC
jgi:hypothetical protein